MTTSFAQDAIAILINLAQQGEIDPWNVQVIEVFDRVLSQIALTEQQDLSHSGQAFLYASMLLLLKSESLDEAQAAADEADADELLGLDESASSAEPVPRHLERHLRRRAVAQPLTRRRVTLNELIHQLKLVAATVEQPITRVRSRHASRPTRSQAARAIAQLAHQENLLDIAAELEQFFAQHWPQESQGQWLDLDTLLGFKDDRVGVFWALLWLSAQSKVELCQTEFYQDLKLRPLSPVKPVSCESDALGLG